MSVLDSDRISEILDTDDLSQIQFVSFDTETTGLSPVVARLVELSGVKFKLSDVQFSTFSSLIDPEMPIPAEVSKIHGITDEMVSDAPKCAEVIPQFLDWIGDTKTVLVAHNAPFDVEFLHVAIARLKREKPSHFVVDTLPFARRALPDSRNHQLRTLIEHLELDAGDYHRALADSLHVRNILHRLIANTEIKTWADLCDHQCVFKFDRDPYSAASQSQEIVEFLASINDAITGGSSLSFVYSGYRTFKRTVDPVALIQSRGTFYLTAYCQKALAERTFRVDKMSQVKPVQLAKRSSGRAEAAS